MLYIYVGVVYDVVVYAIVADMFVGVHVVHVDSDCIGIAMMVVECVVVQFIYVIVMGCDTARSVVVAVLALLLMSPF